jgi:hypothetical protein
LWLLLLGLSGCELAHTVVGPRDEYDAFRRVRSANTVPARLRASHDYLSRFPQGQWVDEVRPWYQRAEARFFVHREQSPPGLQEYLQVLPDGPHAAAARLELERHYARVAEGKRSRLEIEARFTEERLAELARQRENARETFGAWVGRLLAIDSWGDRTSALDHEFIYAWRIDKPGARCVDDRCVKLVELPFELPGGSDQSMRELHFEVVVRLRQGMVHQASLQAPGMFSRVYEAARMKPVLPDDRAARVDAIAFAVEFLGGAAEATLPAARCRRDPVGEVVFHRACDGWSMQAVAASDPAEDDIVVVQGPARSW